MTYNKIILIIYVGYLVLMSFITLIVFIYDKNLAKNETGKRVKEKNLLMLISLGGAIGGYFGRLIAHHKTYKKYFSLIINLNLALELLVLGSMITLIVI